MGLHMVVPDSPQDIVHVNFFSAPARQIPLVSVASVFLMYLLKYGMCVLNSS